MGKLCYALIACGSLLGCSDPLSKPVDLFHNLEGGEIAAQRPPPPGAGQPYPHIGTVPEKPVLPDPAFRSSLQSQLAAERDQKELMASDIKVEHVPPPPTVAAAAPAPAPVPQAAPGSGQAAPVAAAPAGDETDASANATIPAANAPAAAPKPAAPAAPPPPPTDAALQIVGDPIDTPGLPLVPDSPPPPAAIEGVQADQPAPTPHILPAHLATPAGTQVFFAQGDDRIAPSQLQTLKDLVSHRKNQTIAITGLGEAQEDTPDGQEAAIKLGLHRAKAVADALAALHVQQGAMRISARPFGRGAILTLLP